MLDDLNIDDYDYIDFGCSNGNSIRFGVDKFNGTRGIGVDIDPKKIANANERLKDIEAHRGEHIAINYDVLNLDDDRFYKKFRFTTCIHFLEHLFGFVDAKKAIETAIKFSKEFVFITQPFADKDVELFNQNLKTYYSDWTGHTNLMTSYDFYRILRDFQNNGLIKEFIIFANTPILDSSSPFIHPLSAPYNKHEYNEELPPKDTSIKFEGLYKDIGAFLIIDEDIPIDKYYKNVYGDKKIIYDSRKPVSYDYLDFGSGKGASVRYGSDKFGGHQGLGIEINPKLVDIANKSLREKFGKKYAVRKGDVFNLDNSKFNKSYRFTTAIHFLEVLNDELQVKLAINYAINFSKDFVYLAQHNIDQNSELNDMGLKYFYADGDYNLKTSEEFNNMFENFRENNIIKDYVIFNSNLIQDSSSILVIPSTATLAKPYDEEHFPPKDINISFDGIYENLGIFLILKDNVSVDKYINNVKGEKKIIYDSRKN